MTQLRQRLSSFRSNFRKALPALILFYALLALAAIQGPGAPTNVTIVAKPAGSASGSSPCSTQTPYTTFPAGTSASAVHNMVNNASTPDGALLCFAAGSYTAWGGGQRIFTNPAKSVIFACATPGACDVSYSGRLFETMPGNLTTMDTNKFYRWTGFNWTATGAGNWLSHFCNFGSCTSRLRNIRIDHNTWTLPGSENILALADLLHDAYIYGVFDHNVINIQTQSSVKINYAPKLQGAELITRRMGTNQNLFVEDNVWTVVNDTAQGGYIPCLDGQGPGVGVVWRFNTMHNCRIALHGNYQQGGPSNLEAYGNSFSYDNNIINPDGKRGFRSIHHQGAGTFGAFWNSVVSTVGHTGSIMTVQNYRSFWPNGNPLCEGDDPLDGNRQPTATYMGYPCFHQPGRDWDFVLFPNFAFGNFWADDLTRIDLVLNGGGGFSPDWTNFTMQPNRDWYNALSTAENTCQSPGVNCTPFNGSEGIGFGLLQNRPNTCTPTPEALDAGRGGVMYWATDQGSWNQSLSNPHGVQKNGADGVLYHCSATNIWSVYYTPYVYPHPLNN